MADQAANKAITSEARAVVLVICFLGVVLILLTLGSLYLVHEVIGKAQHGKVSPAAVSVLTAVVGLNGTALGAMTSMLVSTSGRSSPAQGDPTTFTAPADATVTVDPAPDPRPVKPSPTEPTKGVRRPRKRTERHPRKATATR